MKVEVYLDKEGAYRIRVRDAQGQIVKFPTRDFTNDWPEEEKARIERNVQAGLRALAVRQSETTQIPR